jgi:hypothetical protein
VSPRARPRSSCAATSGAWWTPSPPGPARRGPAVERVLAGPRPPLRPASPGGAGGRDRHPHPLHHLRLPR